MKIEIKNEKNLGLVGLISIDEAIPVSIIADILKVLSIIGSENGYLVTFG